MTWETARAGWRAPRGTTRPAARRAAIVVAAVAGLLCLPGAGAAQGGGQGGIRVTLNQATIPFPTPGVPEFDAGRVDAAPVIVSVHTPPAPQQRAWELRIRADVPDMGGYGKAISDILWRREGSTTWTPLTTTDQAVVQGTGPQDVTIYLRLRLDYALDLPDNYSADIVFSAQAL